MRENGKSGKKNDDVRGVGDMNEEIEFWQDEEREETERRERIRKTRAEVEKLRKKKLDEELAMEESSLLKELETLQMKVEEIPNPGKRTRSTESKSKSR